MEKNELEIENLIKQSYRQVISAEVSRPEVQAAKNQLLASFYGTGPAFSLTSFLNAGFLVPAFLVLGAFFFLFRAQASAPKIEGPSAPIYRTFGEVLERSRAQEAALRVATEAFRTKQAEQVPVDPVRNHMKPRVIVKRVASEVGSTMVYQRAYRSNPVTVVWVFTPRGV